MPDLKEGWRGGEGGKKKKEEGCVLNNLAGQTKRHCGSHNPDKREAKRKSLQCKRLHCMFVDVTSAVFFCFCFFPENGRAEGRTNDRKTARMLELH